MLNFFKNPIFSTYKDRRKLKLKYFNIQLEKTFLLINSYQLKNKDGLNIKRGTNNKTNQLMF